MTLVEREPANWALLGKADVIWKPLTNAATMPSNLQIHNAKRCIFTFTTVQYCWSFFIDVNHIQIITELDWAGELVINCSSIFSFYLIFKRLLLSELLCGPIKRLVLPSKRYLPYWLVILLNSAKVILSLKCKTFHNRIWSPKEI